VRALLVLAALLVPVAASAQGWTVSVDGVEKVFPTGGDVGVGEWTCSVRPGAGKGGSYLVSCSWASKAHVEVSGRCSAETPRSSALRLDRKLLVVRCGAANR
jgi:hypothetical protein